MRERPGLVSFGLGGHTVYYYSVRSATGSSQCRTQGYESPESFERRMLAPKCESDGAEHFEGVLVVDKCAVLRKTPGYAIASPLVDVDLPAGEVDACPEPSPMLAAGIAGNELGALYRVHKRHQARSGEPGPLDSVSIEEYLRWWRMRGARVGTVRAGRIEWQAPPAAPFVPIAGTQGRLL